MGPGSPTSHKGSGTIWAVAEKNARDSFLQEDFDTLERGKQRATWSGCQTTKGKHPSHREREKDGRVCREQQKGVLDLERDNPQSRQEEVL